MSFGKGIITPIITGIKHIFTKRITKRYPEAGMDIHQEYYSYEPKKGMATPGWKGKHYLELDKCTGCQLCGIMCDEIAMAIIKVEEPDLEHAQNKKKLYPSIDYGRCVFCGLCVDACPFECLHMTPDIELADYDRNALWYSPKELSIMPEKGTPSHVVGKKVVPAPTPTSTPTSTPASTPTKKEDKKE